MGKYLGHALRSVDAGHVATNTPGATHQGGHAWLGNHGEQRSQVLLVENSVQDNICKIKI